MSEISLSCRNLVKFLGEEENRVQALREVSLELERGRVYSIVGPSGCGKSTLLYLLGLLDQPDSGEIFVGEKQSAHLSEDEATRIRNEHLGFIFQFHFLLKEFTAAENVMLPMIRLGKLSETAMKARAQELLEAVGIGHKSGRRANHLSGGEQQRVAIARALANHPEIILADEPTGNLDSVNSDKVFALLKQLAHDRNITVLVVTHNPAIAKASDTVLEMRDGRFI
ncbi:MAG: ABC transporter ATP-binding protein [Verrucomicrobiota bacterium]